jgi:hypothetical protein
LTRSTTYTSPVAAPSTTTRGPLPNRPLTVILSVQVAPPSALSPTRLNVRSPVAPITTFERERLAHSTDHGNAPVSTIVHVAPPSCVRITRPDSHWRCAFVASNSTRRASPGAAAARGTRSTELPPLTLSCRPHAVPIHRCSGSAPSTAIATVPASPKPPSSSGTNATRCQDKPPSVLRRTRRDFAATQSTA